MACAPDGCGIENVCHQCDQPETPCEIALDPCPFCRARQDDCAHCRGEGIVRFPSCAKRRVDRHHLELVQSVALVETGHLPAAGGWQDQPAVFVQAYPLVRAEIEHQRALARELAMQKAKSKRRG